MTSAETGVVKNWAGNITFAARRVHRPGTVAELREIAAGAAKLRALGSGHSFNRIADTDAELVSVARLPRRVEVDSAAAQARISAGMRYAEIAGALDAAGFGLADLASLSHISVAGACTTGTHGSGAGQRNLAAAVAGITLVGAGGDVIELSREQDGGQFAGAVVNLGALGVATSMTLDLVPAFHIAQHVRLAPAPALDGLAQRLTGVLGAAYSVSVFTTWAPDAGAAVWIKDRVGAPEDADGIARASEDLAERMAALWPDAAPARTPQHPVPGVSPEHCTEQLGVPGPWHERLPHFRPEFTPSSGEELQSEFFVDRADAPAAVEALRGVGGRIANVVQISEIRAIAADQMWLSPAYGRDSVAFHFTWIPDAEAVAPVLAGVEARLMPLGARPHWGKVYSVAAPDVIGRYERAADFRQLMRRYDPAGVFRNAFVEALFPGA